MNKIIVGVAGTLWVVVFAVTGIFLFDAPRSWVIHALSFQTQENSNLEASLAAAPVVSIASASASSTADTTPLMQTSGGTSNTTNGTTTYEYKVVESADPCTLNKLGAQGWHAVQFGSNIVQSVGSDESCKKGGIFDSLDWVVFERSSSNN